MGTRRAQTSTNADVKCFFFFAMLNRSATQFYGFLLPLLLPTNKLGENLQGSFCVIRLTDRQTNDCRNLLGRHNKHLMPRSTSFLSTYIRLFNDSCRKCMNQVYEVSLFLTQQYTLQKLYLKRCWKQPVIIGHEKLYISLTLSYTSESVVQTHNDHFQLYNFTMSPVGSALRPFSHTHTVCMFNADWTTSRRLLRINLPVPPGRVVPGTYGSIMTFVTSWCHLDTKVGKTLQNETSGQTEDSYFLSQIVLLHIFVSLYETFTTCD